MKTNINSRALVAAAILAALATVAAGAETSAVLRHTFVQCGDGQRIQAALDGAEAGESLVITVDGMCQEDVMIERDDVTLRAASAGGAISGQVSVAQSQGVELHDLVLTGPGAGLDVCRGEARLRNVKVVGNQSIGLSVSRDSRVVLTDSEVSRNGSSGVWVDENSTLTTQGSNRIKGNGGDGIGANTGASVQLHGASQISDNLGSGLSLGVHAQSQLLDTAVISGNLGNAISLAYQAQATADPLVVISGNAGGVQCMDGTSSFHARGIVVDPVHCGGYWAATQR